MSRPTATFARCGGSAPNATSCWWPTRSRRARPNRPTFACDHEDVEPDIYLLGRRSAAGPPGLGRVSRADVLGVFRPGEHGSTFGGNPIACAVGLEVLACCGPGVPAALEDLGAWFLQRLREEAPTSVTEVRGRGLWFGIELTPEAAPARAVCERLLELGVLAKDTHETTVRLAPPLVVSRGDLEWALQRVVDALAERA